MAKHTCPICSQSCREFKPRTAAFSDTKRDRGPRCAGCNTKGINHADTCPLYLGTRARLIATTPADMALDLAMLAKMAPIPYDSSRVVGCVLYATDADAQAARDRATFAVAQAAAQSEALAQWRAAWKAAALARLEPEPEAVLEAA